MKQKNEKDKTGKKCYSHHIDALQDDTYSVALSQENAPKQPKWTNFGDHVVPL
jgi:hypothetical protein